MLTKKQKKVFDYIGQYTKKNGYAPSLHEIRKRFKLASVSTAHHYISKLKESGMLNKENQKPRSIELVQSGKMISIPILGLISAGSPIEAIAEGKETIAVSQSRLPFSSSKNFYALKVRGDSMIDENINDGDIVLVRHQSTAENGQKVVALIDNSEATLKTFYKERGGIRLQPENKNFEPIIIRSNEHEFAIQGVVFDVVREEKSLHSLVDVVKHTIPEHKRPKGCEIIYKGKLKEEDILSSTKPAKLESVKKYGKKKQTNRLILGDNLNILKTLYEDDSIRGKIKLIYIDPPFGTGQNFVGYDESKFYSDKLINTDFLEFLRKRLIFLRELLADTGSIYLHIDQKIGHYVKIIMDEVFGEENFRNDITRIKCNPKNFNRKAFGNIKDVIYFYSKSKPNGQDPMFWTDYRVSLTDEEIKRQFPKTDNMGRRYATTPLHAKGETRNGPTGKEWKSMLPPKGRHWRYNPEELTRLDRKGLIEWSSTGNPRKIIYADENRGKKLQDIWDFKDPGFESSLYPTQKNRDLLAQIIQSSTKEGDLVLDCFAGSGTTLLVAQELKRNWIGIDINNNAGNLIEKEITKLKASFGVYSAN